MQPRKRLSFVFFLAVSLPLARAQYTQQGSKLIGTGAISASQGWAVALSADGNTAIVGGPNDGFPSLGVAFIFTRSGTNWTQQARLIGSGYVTNAVAGVNQGFAVALSADGNTALVGGWGDNNNQGAAWIFTRSGTTWTQQGNKLLGTGAIGTNVFFGISVALSGDGNTAFIGGNADNSNTGAAWAFARSGSTWNQVAKLTASDAVGQARQGSSVALSNDGTTAIVGGLGDNNQTGASWVYRFANGVWTQQGPKLTGSDSTGAFSTQGVSVSLSSDGNTALVGGYNDNASGAAWVFTRSGTTWTQQGAKLVGSGAASPPFQGFSVSLSGDGNTAVVGGPFDNGHVGAVWVFKRAANGTWSQQGGKLIGSGGVVSLAFSAHGQGHAVAVSGDGNTIIEGSPSDNNSTGAAWVFTQSTGGAVSTAPMGTTPGGGSAFGQTMTFSFSDPRGWQDLDVVNVLVNNFLDGRSACYLAYSNPSSVLYLVSDAGGGLSNGLTLNSTGSISNGQCTVNSAGSSASGSGTTLTLTLNISFTPSFAGNKVTYMAARDQQGNNSGWQALGTWNVPGAAVVPGVGLATPARGSGSATTLTFSFTDNNGVNDLGILNVLINNFLDGRSACYLAYSRPAGVLYLVGDAGGGLSAPLTLGGSGSISNSQCTVNSAGSSASGGGTNFTLVLNISFSGAFDGNRVVYAAARNTTDLVNSGWQSVGSWTVQ